MLKKLLTIRSRTTKEIVDELFVPSRNTNRSYGYSIFCIPILKTWTFKSQIIVSLTILNVASFFLVGLVLGIDSLVIKNNIYSSSVDFLENIASTSLVQAAKHFTLILGIAIQNQFEIMNVVSHDFLNQYDPTRNGTYLNLTNCSILGDSYNSSLHFISDDLPADCPDEINETFVSSYYRAGASQICFDGISYTDFGTSNKTNKKEFSQEGEKILNAAKVLKYFAGDQLFDISVNFMSNIYIGFEIDALWIHYPASKNLSSRISSIFSLAKFKILNPTTYNPKERPWYITAKEMYEKNLTSVDKFIYLTEPYLDEISKKYSGLNSIIFGAHSRVMTLTKALVDQDTFMGIIGCDVSMTYLQQLFDGKNYFNTSKMILTNQNGVILNDPFIGITIANATPTYFINDTQFTNITLDEWLQIKDRKNENSTLKVNDGKIVIVRAFLDSYSPEIYYVLIFCIQISEFNEKIDQTKASMEQTFLSLTFYDIGVSVASVLCAVVVSAMMTSRLIGPLKKLTLYAKAVNQTAHSRDENKKMRKKLNFDINQLQGKGLIGELIITFRSMVKTLKVQTSARRVKDNPLASFQKQVFPVSLLTADFSAIREQLPLIKNLEVG